MTGILITLDSTKVKTDSWKKICFFHRVSSFYWTSDSLGLLTSDTGVIQLAHLELWLTMSTNITIKEQAVLPKQVQQSQCQSNTQVQKRHLIRYNRWKHLPYKWLHPKPMLQTNYAGVYYVNFKGAVWSATLYCIKTFIINGHISYTNGNTMLCNKHFLICRQAVL